MISRADDAQRETVQLWISVAIVIVLSAYRLMSSLLNQVEDYFRGYTELPVAELISNMLFFWLLALLWIAYRRWRSVTAQKFELERILTGISPDSVAVINRNRIITMCSGQVESMFGYRGKELIGKQTDALYFDRRVRGESGEIAKRLEEYGFHVGYATGKRRDGGTFPLEIITGMIKRQQGAVILMRDITERRNTEDALRNSEERFELFMRYLPGCAFVKDSDGKHIYLNSAYERVYGWNIADCIGKTDGELFPADLAAQFAKSDRKVLDEKRATRYVTRITQQDGPRAMLTFKFPIPAQDKGRPMIGGIALDITDQEKAEEERHKIEKQMQQAQKLESLGVLGGGIAHDFNNLLVGMLGHADLALTQLPGDAPARQNIEEVIASAQRAADLANQLLAYAGEGKFVVEAVSLSDLVQEMHNLVEVSISKKAILELDLCRRMPAVKCDTTQIRQVIMNLIVNASDALEGRPGTISIRTGSVHRTTLDFADTYLGRELPAGQYVFVRVSDTGIGMDEATLSRIFDPFFTTKFAGRGLGLAAVMGIIRGHSGAVKLESEPGKGTAFTVYLPASEEHHQMRQPTEAGKDEHWEGHGLILVADDEETVRNVAKMMLEAIGFEVMLVEDGRAAVDTFKTVPGRFCAVLLDITMPELDGVEVYHEIRKIDAAIPIVLSSGYNKREDVEHVPDDNPPVFLKKPYRLDSVRSIFRTALADT